MQLGTKLLLTLVIIGLSLAGCKKDKESKYYLKYKVNGDWITWTDVFADLGPDVIDVTKTNFGLESWDPDKKDAFDIYLQVAGNNLGTGTYNNNSHSLVVHFKFNAHEIQEEKYGLHQVAGKPAPQFTITLTSITAEEIRGLFNANYLAIDGTTQVIEITEGEFYVPRIR